VQGIFARKKLLDFDRLWIDCIQEEARLESRNGRQKGSSDENQVVVSHTRKGRKVVLPRERHLQRRGRRRTIAR
jgi:hypothetical protein